MAGRHIIGAVAAVGLRLSDNDGRFIELRGVRQAQGVLSVADILATTGVESVRTADNAELPPDARVDTQDWLRPRLVNGRPVLLVKPHPLAPGGWTTLDTRNRESTYRQRRQE